MKKRKIGIRHAKVLCLVLFFLFYSRIFVPQNLLAGFGVNISGDVSVYSQYIWRGMVLDRDAVAQSSIYLTYPVNSSGKFKIGAWSSQDLENKDSLKSEEFDYVLDYTCDFERLNISLGHTYYDFVDTDTFSREFYLGLTLKELLFSPSVFCYRDYGRSEDGGGEGTYILISGSKSIPIKNRAFTLDLGAHAGFNHELFIAGDGGDLGFKLGVNMPLAKDLIFSPNINFSHPFSDLRNQNDGNQKDRVYCGCTLTYSF